MVNGKVYDFTHFEDTILLKWLDLFTIDFDAGTFSFHPKSKTASVYGTIDVVHVLGSVGYLETFDSTRKDAWAQTIDSFQIEETGFYRTEDHAPGHQPYHGAGEATASLALLGRKPRYNNSVYISLAKSTPDELLKFFQPLVQANGTTCYKAKLGGNNIHSCGQIIGSIPSVLAYTTGKDYYTFLQWWSEWLAENTDPKFGVICPIKNTTFALYECLGGGMATHGIQLGMGMGFNLSNPQALLQFALKMQDKDGFWNGDGGSMTLDGMFQVVRSSLQLDHVKWDTVKKACSVMLAKQEKHLKNDSYVLEKYGKKSHDLANVLASIAECAMHFPELVQTRRPWTCCARYV